MERMSCNTPSGNAIEALALPEGVERTVHQNRLLKLAREGRK